MRFNNFLFLTIGAVLINGCSDSSTSTKIDAQVPGSYLMSGNKIVTKYSDWPISENEEPTVDTLRVDFILVVAIAESKEDAIRLYGLQGVDTGEGDNRVYPNCTIPEECEFFGRLEGEDLEIDVNNNGRSYQATGKIYQTFNPYIEISATFNYQNTTIHYKVEGEK